MSVCDCAELLERRRRIAAAGGLSGAAAAAAAGSPDFWIPVVGGSLAFFGFLGLFYNYFDLGTLWREKFKTMIAKIADSLCDPSLFAGLSTPTPPPDLGPGGRGYTGSHVGKDGKKINTSFEAPPETPVRRASSRNPCGNERIHSNRRKHLWPDSEDSAPRLVIPGLHDCDDEDYEEGVFMPGH